MVNPVHPTQLFNSPITGEVMTPGGGIDTSRAVPTPNLIDTANAIPLPQIATEAAEQRARVYHEVLGELSPGISSLAYRVSTPGGDQALRNEYSARMGMQLNQKRNDLIAEYMRQRPQTPYTQGELEQIRRLGAAEIEEATKDPMTFFERAFARRVADVPERTNTIARLTAPDTYEIAREAATRTSANQQVAANLLEEIEARRKKMSWGEAIGEHLYQAVPFLSWWRTNSALQGPSVGSVLSGNNLREQAMYYYSLPPEEAARRLRTAVQQLEGQTGGGLVRSYGNQLDAIYLLQVLSSPSSLEFAMGNAMSVFDVATVLPYRTIGRAGRAVVGRTPTPSPAAAAPPPGALPPPHPGPTVTNTPTPVAPTPAQQTAINNVAQTQRDVNMAAAVSGGDPAAVHVAAGNVRTAAEIAAQDKVIARAGGAGRVESFDQVRHETMSIFDIPAVMHGARLSAKNELAERLVETGQVFTQMLANPVSVSRLRPGGSAERAAGLEADLMIREVYSHAAEAIADISSAATGTAFRTFEEQLVQMPASLRPLARQASDAHLDITRRDLTSRYSQWRRVGHEFNEIIRALSEFSQQVPKVDKKGNLSLSSILKNIGMDTEDIKAAVQRASDLNKSRTVKGGVFSPEEIKLFSSADAGVRKFEREAARIGYTGEIPRARKDILDLVNIKGYEPRIVQGLGGVRNVEVRFHNRDLSLFESEASAIRAASEDYKFPKGSYEVRSSGDGHYIAVRAPLNETSPLVRAQIAIETSFDRTPRDWGQRITPFLRTPDYTVSRELADLMKTATYGSSAISSMVNQIVNRAFGDLKGKFRWSKAEVRDFSKFIEAQRVQRNPLDPSEVGAFSRTQLDFETDFIHINGKMPSLNQSVAYWSMVQVMDYDYALLNIGLTSGKTRNGTQLIGLAGMEPSLEGRILYQMPTRAKDWNYGIVVRDEQGGLKNFWWGREGDRMTNPKIDKEIAGLQGKGYKIVQISHLSEDQVRLIPGFNSIPKDFNVDFILTKEVRTSPLGYKQVERRGGVHHMYDDPYMIRQANVRNGTYYGDTSLHPVRDPQMGAMWAARYEVARELTKDILLGATQKIPALTKYLTENMPYSYKEWMAMFDPRIAHKFKLDVNEAFHLTPTNSRVADKVSYPRDIRNKPHNMLDDVNLQYALERGEGLKTIETTGSKNKPVYNLKPAEMIDAGTALSRASQTMAKNRYLGDLQVRAANDFISEFGTDTARANNMFQWSTDQMWRNPTDALFNAPFKPGVEVADPTRYQAAKNLRETIQSFMNIRSAEENQYLRSSQRLADMLDGGWIDAPWIMRAIKSPVQSIRSFLHYFMLMGPQQMAVQASGAFYIMAAEGAAQGTTRAYRAVPAAIYSRWLFRAFPSDEMIEHAASKIGSMGWSKDNFIEAYKGLRDTGFYNVGREYSTIDDFAAPAVVSSAGGKVLDLGMKPFKWGEEYVRHAAWYASYDKWRTANPKSVFTNEARTQVLAYADQLTGRMSSASRAPWQSSEFTSWAGSFASYYAHLMEDMWSAKSRFSVAQRMGILAHNAAFFGLPASVGILTFGVPVQQLFQRMVTDEGKFINNDTEHLGVPGWVWNIMSNGFLTAGIEAAGGGQLALSSRLAPGTSRFVTDALRDKTFFETATGPVGSLMADGWRAIDPFMQWTLDPLRAEGNRTNIRLNMTDVQRVLNVMPAISQAERTIIALNYGRYFDRNGLPVTDQSRWHTMLFALTGIQPMDFERYYSHLANEKAQSANQRIQYRQMQYWYNEMWRKANQGDLEGSEEARLRVYAHRVAGGWAPHEMSSLWNRLSRGNEDAIENAFRRYSRESPETLKFWEDFRRSREGQ